MEGSAKYITPAGFEQISSINLKKPSGVAV
jgi:hypothetical protein